jgi:hypothetical protein
MKRPCALVTDFPSNKFEPSLYMKQKIVNLFCLLVMAMASSAQITVSFTLRPPFSANIRDYYHLENKAIIVLSNTSRSTLNIKLGGSISNQQRGVYIRTTPGYMPPEPITLGPGGTVTLTANANVMRFFDQGNVETNANDAMAANIIRTGMLPEGNYQVCIQAYDYTSGKQLSVSGMGCFSFDVAQLDPPLITFPQNNYKYPATQKNLNFSWTPPLGNLAGSLIEYDQVVVRIQPGQNPNDAIAAARDFKAGNPVIDRRSGLGQTYITQPYDLPFEPGHYAMQVVARDRNQKVLLNNQGRSEIVLFEVGRGMANTLPDLELSENDDPWTATILKGKLRYYWHGVNGSASNYNNFGNYITPDNNGGNTVELQNPFRHNYYGFSGWQNSPLAGVTVKLLKAVQYENPVITGNTGAAPSFLPGGLWLNSSTVLATATTTSNGSFTFNAPSAANIDFGWKTNPYNGGSGEHGYTITGRHRTVLVVQIGSGNYYANPIQFVSGIPSNGEMGTFYSRVHTFNCKVKVADNDDHALVKPGIEVIFMRKDPRNMMVPRDEGHPGNFNSNPRTPSDPTSYEIVYKSTGVTDGNGEVLVENIVLENCGNYGKSPYYIRSRYKDAFNSQHSLHHMTYDHIYATKGQWNDTRCVPAGRHTMSGECGEETCLSVASIYSQLSTTSYTPTQFYHIQGVVPIKARTYALVKNGAAGTEDNMGMNLPGARWYLYQLNAAAVQQAKLIAANARWGQLAQSAGGLEWLKEQLYNRGAPMVMLRTGVTTSDGRVNEELLPYAGYFDNPTGFWYILSVEKHGFKTATRVVNYQPGNGNGAGDAGIAMTGVAYNLGIIEMQPKGKARLTLVNEQGTLIDGSANYYDPNTGMEGEVVDAAGPNRYINLDLPSGDNRKIIIRPYPSSIYMRDTISVDVPADETLVKEVVVKYKLHRIYFNIKNSNGERVDKARVEMIEVPDNITMYNDLRSPWLYEGAHSNIPPPNNPPGQQGNQQNNNNGNNYGNMNNIETPEIIGPYTKFTNNGGGVDFAFKNSGTSFKFRITGPDGEMFSYIVKDKVVSSTAGADWKRVNVTIQLGRNVSGTVKFGTVPVANARVRIKGVEPMIQVFTNSLGVYKLKGVPLAQNLTFTASKQGYIGMEFTEGQSTQSAYGVVGYESGVGNALNTIINFKLRIYDGLDLSKLLGFPLEVTNLEETAGAISSPRGGNTTPNKNTNPVRISGLVSVADNNNAIFKMDGTTADGKKLNTIDFNNLLVVADDIKNDSGIPFCRPQNLPVQTTVNEQPVKIYNFYQATMYDSTVGITLTNYGTGNSKQGVAQGKMRVEASSFADNGLGFQHGINLVNGNSMQFPVFTANGAAVVNASQGIGIGSWNGTALRYNLHTFPAIAAAGTSKLYKDSVILDTRLQTYLQHVAQPNLDLPIGRVRINKQRMLEDVNNAISKTTPLGGFGLQWTRIYVNEDGVQFDAVLNAAGMNMPVSKAYLYPDHFWIPQGTLQTSNAKLINTIPLTVYSEASFGYDATRPTPAWYLAITSGNNDETAAEIKGQHLDGLGSNVSVPLSSVWFYSTGEQYLSLRNNLPVYRLYNVANFSLQSIFLHTNQFTMAGALTPGIPAFPTYNTALIYSTSGSTLSPMSLQPFSMPDIPINGVVLAFNGGTSNSIQFSDGQMQIRGRVRDENPDVFKDVLYTLTKNSQETKLVLDETPQKQQIKLGGSSSNSRIMLSNIEGRMWVTNNAWNHLYFNGDMPEDMGFTGDGKRMRFDVNGALSVNSQSVKLKKMNSPVSGLSMTYDMAAHRLVGGLHFSNKVGTMAVEGDIEMVVDKLGYYFMAAGSMEMNNPKVTGSAFMLFGDYDHKRSDMRAGIEETLKQYSVYYQNLDELPNGYLNMDQINGFFFEAAASIPFPGIPNFDINLGVIDAALEVNVGGDVRLAMAFGDTDFYNMGLGVFVDARFKLGVTAINVCGGVDLHAIAGVDIDGSYYTNGNYTLEAKGFIKLTGTAYAGIGLACGANCEGVCTRDEVSGTIILKAIGSVTQDDSDFEIVLDANSFPQD